MILIINYPIHLLIYLSISPCVRQYISSTVGLSVDRLISLQNTAFLSHFIQSWEKLLHNRLLIKVDTFLLILVETGGKNNNNNK